MNALLSAGDTGVADYAQFAELFGTDEVIVVQIAHTDLQVVLQIVTEVTELLEGDSTIERVISPSAVYASEMELLGDQELGGSGELPRLAPRFKGPLNRALRLFDPETKTATLYALGKVRPADERLPLATALNAKKAALAAAGGQMRLAGPALLNLELDRAGRDVSQKALPLLALVAIVFLLLNTRSLVLSAAVLSTTALGVFAGDGVLGFFGVATNIIVDISKPLLLVLILASGLHISIGFMQERHSGATTAEAARNVVASKGRAVILSFLTTATGFGSLAISPVLPIRNFGLVTAGTLLFGIPLTLFLLPAILAVVGGSVRTETEGRLERFAVWAIRWSRAHDKIMIVLALIGLTVGVVSLFELRPDPHAIKYFRASHPLRQDYEALEASGLGLSTVEVVLSSTVSFSDRSEIEGLDRLARAFEKIDGVRAVVGLPLFVREASFHAGGSELIPEQVLIDSAMETRASELRDFLSGDRKHARLALLIETLDADRLDALDTSVRRLIREQLPHGEPLITGNYRLLLSTQRSLIDTMKWSLFGTAILMEIAFLILLRSLRLSLATLIPNLFPVALNYALMRFAGIPLDLGTAMTGAIALGIAVDNEFHYVDGWKKAGAEATARENGRAMIVTSIVIGAGFLSLVLSDFGPTRNFGLLASIGMLTALFADMFVLTPMLDLVSSHQGKK